MQAGIDTSASVSPPVKWTRLMRCPALSHHGLLPESLAKSLPLPRVPGGASRRWRHLPGWLLCEQAQAPGLRGHQVLPVLHCRQPAGHPRLLPALPRCAHGGRHSQLRREVRARWHLDSSRGPEHLWSLVGGGRVQHLGEVVFGKGYVAGQQQGQHSFNRVPSSTM